MINSLMDGDMWLEDRERHQSLCCCQFVCQRGLGIGIDLLSNNLASVNIRAMVPDTASMLLG